jgi:hypothetical protein
MCLIVVADVNRLVERENELERIDALPAAARVGNESVLEDEMTARTAVGLQPDVSFRLTGPAPSPGLGLSLHRLQLPPLHLPARSPGGGLEKLRGALQINSPLTMNQVPPGTASNRFKNRAVFRLLEADLDFPADHARGVCWRRGAANNALRACAEITSSVPRVLISVLPACEFSDRSVLVQR